jgi:hypothetical protein
MPKSYAERIGMRIIHESDSQLCFYAAITETPFTARHELEAAVARIVAEDTAGLRAERDRLAGAARDFLEVLGNNYDPSYTTSDGHALILASVETRTAAVRAAAGLEAKPE